MANLNRLGKALDKAYAGVAAVSEGMALAADIADEVGVAVQKGIDHIQEVYPQLFEEDDKIDITGSATGPYTTHRSTPAVNSSGFFPPRQQMIKEVQDFLRSNGVYKGEWFEHPWGIPEAAVRMAWSITSEDKRAKQKMNDFLRTATRGDRFGNTDAAVDKEWEIPTRTNTTDW